MTIASQPRDWAVSMMVSAGWRLGTCKVVTYTPAASAWALAASRTFWANSFWMLS